MNPLTPEPNYSEVGPNSCNSELVIMDAPNELTGPRPTSEAIRKYLASKPWLLPAARRDDTEHS